MKKLFKELTTEENIYNFARIVAIFIIIACTLLLVNVVTNPPSASSFGMLD